MSQQLPHQQKFAVSEKDSHASQEEAAQLTTNLHNLISKADWTRKQADFHWATAKEYEAQSRVDMAQKQRQFANFSQKIGNITIWKYKRLQKGSNAWTYIFQKDSKRRKLVKEPPSDNQE